MAQVAPRADAMMITPLSGNMRTEAQLYRWLLDEVLIGSHSQRIENTAGSGVPDINCCWNGIEIWIECKMREPLLRPFQWAWINRRVRAGGNVFVIVERETCFLVYCKEFSASNHGKYMLLSGTCHVVPKSSIALRNKITELVNN